MVYSTSNAPIGTYLPSMLPWYTALPMLPPSELIYHQCFHGIQHFKCSHRNLFTINASMIFSTSNAPIGTYLAWWSLAVFQTANRLHSVPLGIIFLWIKQHFCNKFNRSFYFTPNASFCCLVCWLARLLVRHNLLNGRDVNISCAYRSTCLILLFFYPFFSLYLSSSLSSFFRSKINYFSL